LALACRAAPDGLREPTGARVEGAVEALRVGDSIVGLEGAWVSGGGSARLVTVPPKLKFDSSRGPISSVAAGGGEDSAALFCAAKGTAASIAAAKPAAQIKPLYLLAKIQNPRRSRSGLWPASRVASRLGCD
jgi:hypothetical protein